MAVALVNCLCTTSFRPLLGKPVAAGKLKRSWPSFSSPSISLHGNGSSFKISSSLSTKDYIEQSKESVGFDDDGGPPRWFSPLECGCRLTGSPLLLFLPGIDGNGLGLTLQYKKLGEIFDIWCLHVPASDRTPLQDLVMLVQNAVKTEQDQSVESPIYLVGESFGVALALLVAAHNPDIDFVLILANPATNFIKSLVHSVAPLLLHGMRSTPVMWKLKMIQDMQFFLNSHIHAVKAQTLILTSGKDMHITSITEGGKLSSILQNSQTHTFSSNSDPLFSDDKFDLVAALKCTGYYRRGASVDYITDFLPPTSSELKSIIHPFRWMDAAVDPVMLSTMGAEEHKLFWPEEAEFVRMAARFGAKILPFGIVGEDDLLQLLLDCDDQMKIPPLNAQMEALTSEFVRLRSDVEGEIAKQIIYSPIVVPKLPGRFYFFFGEPICTEGRKDVLRNKDKARELYLEVKTETQKCIQYLKDRREKDPYRNLFVRLA